MNRKMVGLVSAAALAVVGTMVLVAYVRSAEARALEGERLVDVLVVSKTIEAGTPVSEIAASVKNEEVPQKVRATSAITRLSELEGLVAAVDLLPGEQLVRNRFVTPAVQERGDLPPGLLEVTVALDPARAVGGQIAAGDTVGVIASFDDNGPNNGPATHLILHKVQVSAVQVEKALPEEDDRSDQAALAPTGKLLVTLAVDAPSAERIVFAVEHGRLWLTAEPADANEGGTQVQSKGSVFG